jgi:hypothetical protein
VEEDMNMWSSSQWGRASDVYERKRASWLVLPLDHTTYWWLSTP